MGGVFDFCDCDWGGACGVGGAAGGSRRAMNGGVGTLGGVADRLRIGVEAEAGGVEVRGGSSVLGGARVFQRAFFGILGRAESTASNLTVVSVFVFAVAVTIGGTEAIGNSGEFLSPPGSAESIPIGVSLSTPPKRPAGEGATGISAELNVGVGGVIGGKLAAGADTGTIGTGVAVFFLDGGFSALLGLVGGNFGGGTADPMMGTPAGTTGGAVFIAIARATIRGSGMIPFPAASRAASTARPFLLLPSRSRFFFGPANRGH